MPDTSIEKRSMTRYMESAGQAGYEMARAWAGKGAMRFAGFYGKFCREAAMGIACGAQREVWCNEPDLSEVPAVLHLTDAGLLNPNGAPHTASEIMLVAWDELLANKEELDARTKAIYEANNPSIPRLEKMELI